MKRPAIIAAILIGWLIMCELLNRWRAVIKEPLTADEARAAWWKHRDSAFRERVRAMYEEDC